LIREGEKVSKYVPTKDEVLSWPGMLDTLSNDVSGVYSVDTTTHQLNAYFVGGNRMGMYNCIKYNPRYEHAMEVFISQNVYKDDQNEMRYVMEFNYVSKILEKQVNFIFHFRVNWNKKIHYYYVKCSRNRIKSDQIILVFACEDNQVNDRKLQYILETDILTGLYTKEAFLQYSRQLLDDNPENDFDVVLVDVKNFRLLNNIYGVEKGNELLKTLAEYLVDSHSKELWGRFSGDQFIGMGRHTNLYTMKSVSEIVEGFNEISPVPDIVLKCGLYDHVDKDLPIEYMCDRALIALKSIKPDYNQLTAHYDGEISKQHYKAQLYETCFPMAINKREFVVWYQPKYDPYQMKVVGAEALVRWCREGKNISPGEFLPVFEEDGLILKLDEFVFESVCEYQHRRKERELPIIPISVNLSRVTLRQPDAVERFSKIASNYGVDSAYLPIEITESTAIESRDIKSLVEDFRKHGFPIHMDDFGSGHSSLSSLNVLKFDVLKIDKGLIDFIGDENGEAILYHTILMANDLKLSIVAEGVEKEQQLDFLKKMGCDLIQGYYFSKPLSELGFDELLNDSVTQTSDIIKRTENMKETLSEQIRKHDQIIHGLSEVFAVFYYIDLESRTYQNILVENETNKILNVINSAEEALNDITEKMVASQTREIMRYFNDIDTIAERTKNKKIQTQGFVSDTNEWSRAFILPVESDEYGNTKKIVYVLRKSETKQNLEEQLVERSKNLESLTKIYFAIYAVNVQNSYYVQLAGKKEFNAPIPQQGNAVENIQIVLDKCVLPEFKEGVRCFFDFTTVKERLKGKDVISYDYKRGTSGWSRAVMIAGDRDEQGAIKDVFITIRIINDEKEKEFRNQEEAKKNVLLSVIPNQLLGTIEMAPDILQKSRIGLWSFELDEGMPPRMYIDDTMRELMGITEQLPPEETYNAWYTRIDVEHYDEVDATTKEMILGMHAEVKYPWHHPDGTKRMVRCGGVRNYQYKRGIRIEGCHQDITDMIHFQKKEATELLAALSSNISTLFFVEPESGEYEYWTNGENVVNVIYSKFDMMDNFYNQIGEYVQSIVIPEDQEIVYNFVSKNNLKKVIETGEAQEYEVRWCIDEHKKVIWTKTRLVRYKEVNGIYKIVIGVENITERKAKEEQTKLLRLHSYVDVLTGFLNKRAFNEALVSLEEDRTDESIVFVSMDVNGLKATNDTLGHAAGDELIVGAASCIKRCFGAYGKLYRIGGDEFTAIINVNDSKLEAIKEDFKNVVSTWKGNLVEKLSVSCGYVNQREFLNLSIYEILQIADKRMYEEKASFYRKNGVDRSGNNMAYDAISIRYTKILKINLSNDTCQIMKMARDEKIKEKGYSDKISNWLYDFASAGQIHPDDVEYFLKNTNPRLIQMYFKEGKDLLLFHYRRKIGNEFQRVEMELLRADDYTEEEQTMYLYVKVIDE